MSDPTKKRVRAHTAWSKSKGGRTDGERFFTPWFHTNKELSEWVEKHPDFHGGHKIMLEYGSAIRKSIENTMKSMTYGELPKYADFKKHYSNEVGERSYHLNLRGQDAKTAKRLGYYTEMSLDEIELYQLVEVLTHTHLTAPDQKFAEQAGDLASSILSTLGFEWI